MGKIKLYQFYMLIIFLFAGMTSIAQTVTINGPTTVSIGVNNTYTADFRDANNTAISAPEGTYSWNNGTIVSSNESSAVIKFYSSTYIWYAMETWNNYYYAGLTVGVEVPVPDASTSNTFNCGNTVVTRSNTPPSTVKWYWQTSATGTSTSLGYGSSVTLYTTCELYLRAQLVANASEWSTAQTISTNLNVTQNSVGGSISGGINGYSPLSGTLSLTGSTGAVQKWQKQINSGTWTDVSSTSATLSYSGLTSSSGTTTYTYRAEVKSGACSSVNSSTTTITVFAAPVIAISGGAVIAPAESKTLSVAAGWYSYLWNKNGTTLTGETSNTLLIDHPATYSVVVKATSTSSTSTTSITVLPTLESQNYNYIVSTTFQKSGITSDHDVYTLQQSDFSQNVQYIDGLGRPTQTVNLGASPMARDLIQPNEYDIFGREAKKYLPYARSSRDGRYVATAISSQTAFYTSSDDNIANDTAAYSKIIFDPSPQNRPLKQGSPGSDWQPNSTNSYTATDHTVKYAYEFNAGSEVLLWSYTYPTSSYPFGKMAASSGSTPVYYGAGELSRKKTKDEAQHEVIEYTDKEGKILLKRVQANASPTSVNDTDFASTYYIYDDFRNLVCVVPPEAIKRLSTEFYQTGATDATKEDFLKRWAFRYTYDGLKRMIQKQVPGADPVYMVYDNRDRLVLTQDGNQRTAKQWLFTKYDTLNRPVATGIYTHDSVKSQSWMSARISTVKFCEKFDGNAYTCGYTSTVFPTANLTYLTLTYYDTYDFNQGDQVFEYVPGDATGQPASRFTRTFGMITGTRVKVLGGEPQWIKSISYYDDKGRVIQTIGDQYRSGIERTTTVYDFTGKVIRTKTKRTDHRLSWTNLTAAQVKKDKILQTSGGGWGSCSAASVESLPASTDGWIEATLSNNTHWATIGLSHQQNSGGAYNNDYSFFMSNDTGIWWNLVINEPSGFVYFAPGKVAFGDRVRIERIGTTVYYKLNDVVVYTSPTSSSGALYVNVGMADAGSYVYRPRTSFSVKMDSVMRRYSYDHAGRMLKTYHKLNNNTEVLLIQNEYNELGQLLDKKLHSTNSGSNFKQSIDYRYNIRGWLTKINESNVQDAGNLAADGSAVLPDLFGMELGYNASIGTGNTGLYNGNISAMKWSSNLSMGTIKDVSYNYSYDPMNRILSAAYKKDSIGGWSNPSNAFSESGYDYDLNGNIKALTRKGFNGVSMDVLSYDYGSSATSNKLLNVSDTGNKTAGFMEPTSTSGNDYDYDNNGNMVRDNNKKISAIYYNHLNLPAYLTKETGENLIYVYDATGRKHSQDVYSSSWVLQKSTEYSGEYFYENDTLKFINHEEGRIVMTGATPEYQYHLKDHLGNVRMTFTSARDVDSNTGTLEDANVTAEYAKFPRFSKAKRVYATLLDHTNGSSPGYSQRLNGSTNEKFGLDRSLSVMPGDTVKIEVYAKYIDPNTSNWTGALSTLMGQIAGGTSGVVVDGAGYSSSTSSFPSSMLGHQSTTNNGAPKAYLNWLIFDRSYRYITGGFKQITTAAKEAGSDVAHEHVVPSGGDIIINEPGYVYVYLSNEETSPVEVYFDDFKVVQVKSSVVQQQDYYPFGLSFNEYQRENSTINNYKYNGKEEQTELGIFTYDYGSRMYDAALGKWWQVDPLSEKYQSWSSYAYVMNNPLKLMDPTGMFSTHTNEEGEVVAVYDDGDNGVYKHEKNADGGSVTKNQIDKRHEKSTSGNGEKMGETEHWDEFVNGDGEAEGTIHFGESQSWDPLVAWGNDHANNQDLTITMEESKHDQVLDIKTNEQWAPDGPMTGRLLDGKYATARSAGNYLAGMNGVTGTVQGQHISGETYMKLAGAYQAGELSAVNIARILTTGASFGPAPYYGEQNYSGRMIQKGIDAGNNKLKK